MNVRAYAPEDAEAVAALVAAEDEAYYGRPSRIEANDVAKWTEHAGEAWTFEEDGSVLGAGWYVLWGDTASIAGIAGAKGRGIGTELVRRGEAWVDGRQAVKIQGIVPEPDAAARRLFESRGYREVRRFYDMAIELGEEPPKPAVPDGLALDEFRPGEERAFHAALDDAFQDHWDWQSISFEEWWKLREGQHRDEEGPLWLVVRDGAELAAVVRNEARRHGGGFVAALGVRRPWRGRGLAKALMYRTFAEFRRRGTTRVTLVVDAASPTGATRLYERVGMHVESSMVLFEKTLR